MLVMSRGDVIRHDSKGVASKRPWDATRGPVAKRVQKEWKFQGRIISGASDMCYTEVIGHDAATTVIKENQE
ncbi:hypothetical protein Ancab_021218 [Ancistrocladus abbreviatus]